MMKKGLLLGLLACVLFIVASCGRAPDITVTGFEIDTSSITEAMFVDEFELTDIELIVTKSDDSSERIPLAPSMLSSAHRTLLTTPGVHTITVNYEGFTNTFTVELLVRYTDLELQVMAIYDLGVATGLIVDDYEDWLESIRGPAGPAGADGLDGQDGVSIVAVAINELGHLMVTLSNGDVINAGKVVGEAGPTGPEGPVGPIGSPGSDGQDGIDGRDGIDGQDGLYVVDIYVDEFYDVIIELSDGTVINAGNVAPEPKLSAYELYLLYNPWYDGDEMQWIHDLAYGNLEPPYNLQDPVYPDNVSLLSVAYDHIYGSEITVAGMVVSYTYNYVLLERDGDYLMAWVGWDHPYRIGDLITLTGHVYTHDHFIMMDSYQTEVISLNHYVDIEHSLTDLTAVYAYDTHDYAMYHGKPIVLEGAIVYEHGRIYLAQDDHRIMLNYFNQAQGNIGDYLGEHVRIELHYLGEDWSNVPVGLYDPDIHSIEIIEGDDTLFVALDAEYLSSAYFEAVDNRVYLPTSLPNTSTVTWVSQSPEFIGNDGYVHTPPDSSMYVVFDAMITKGDVHISLAVTVYINVLDLQTIGSLGETDLGRAVHVEGVIYYYTTNYVYLYDGTGYMSVPNWLYSEFALGDTLYVKGYYSDYGGKSIEGIIDYGLSMSIYDPPVFSTEPYMLNELYADETIEAGMVVRVIGYVNFAGFIDADLLIAENDYTYSFYIFDLMHALESYLGQYIEIEVLITSYTGDFWMSTAYEGGYLALADMEPYLFDMDINWLLNQSFESYGDSVYLPASGPNETTFTYESQQIDYILNDGTVVMMPEITTHIEFIVQASRGGVEQTVTITVSLIVLEVTSLANLTDADIGTIVMVEGVVYDYLEHIVIFISDETGQIMVFLFDYTGPYVFEYGDTVLIAGEVYKQFGLFILEDVFVFEAGTNVYAMPVHAGNYTLDALLADPVSGGTQLTIEGIIAFEDGDIRIYNNAHTIMGIIFSGELQEDYLRTYEGLFVTIDVVLFGIEDYGTMLPVFIYTSLGSVTLAGDEAKLSYDINTLISEPIYTIDDVILPSTGTYGTAFTYTSLAPLVMSDAGVILEMPAETTEVTFEVRAVLGAYEETVTLIVIIYVEETMSLGLITESTFGAVEGVVYGILSNYYALIYDGTGYAVIYHDGSTIVTVGDTLYHIGDMTYYDDEIIWIDQHALFKTTTVYAMPVNVGVYSFENFLSEAYVYGTVFTMVDEFVLVHLETHPTDGLYIYTFMVVPFPPLMFMFITDEILEFATIGEMYTINADVAYIIGNHALGEYGFVVLAINEP